MSVESTKRRFSDVTADSSAGDLKKPKLPFQEKSLSLINESSGLSRCFHRVKAKMYLSLAPCYLEKPVEGLRQQHLDPLIMTYNPKVEGIIISYNNVKLAKENFNTDKEDSEFKYVAKISDENPFTFVWAYVDFVVWKPRNGDKLEGYTIMQSQSHIGLLINDVFNASIKKFFIPENWYFVPNQADETNNDENNFKKLGHWCDGDGLPVGGKIKFTVRAIHVNGKGLSIEGTLLTPEMEKDSQPVMLDNIKENIKKHVKFDGEDESQDANIDVDSLPVIEPIDDVTDNDKLNIQEDNNGSSTDNSSNSSNSINKDDAPTYNESSDSESDKKSSEDSDSDSDNDSDTKNGSDSDSDSGNGNSDADSSD